MCRYINSIVNYYFLNSHKNNVIKKLPEDIQFKLYEFTGYGYHICTNGLYHIVERKRE